MDASLDRRIANMEEHIAVPRQNGALVFAAPWEARAFGMAVALNDSGLYEWRDFSQSLAAQTVMDCRQVTTSAGWPRDER